MSNLDGLLDAELAQILQEEIHARILAASAGRIVNEPACFKTQHLNVFVHALIPPLTSKHLDLTKHAQSMSTHVADYVVKSAHTGYAHVDKVVFEQDSGLQIQVVYKPISTENHT
jgi:hypothetical protein